MPIVIRPRRTRAIALAVIGAALFASFTPTAARAETGSGSGCPDTPTTKAFERFGDSADYSLLSNGHFESGTSGWSLNRSSVVTGNESFKVRSSGDSKSLALQSSGSAVSPAFCVSDAHPSFRFFGRRTGGSWGVLYVDLRWTDRYGQTRDINVGALSGATFTSWQPSASLPLATTLPLWQKGATLNVRMVFRPERSGGNWAIDDVYIDPYRR